MSRPTEIGGKPHERTLLAENRHYFLNNIMIRYGSTIKKLTGLEYLCNNSVTSSDIIFD